MFPERNPFVVGLLSLGAGVLVVASSFLLLSEEVAGACGAVVFLP